jgi:hypothetical protein
MYWQNTYKCLGVEAADDITLLLDRRLSMALVTEVSTPSAIVMLGRGDNVDEVAIASEVLPCSGRPQTECDEIQTLSESSEAGVNSLLGGVQVLDSFRGGAVAGDVGGDPPVLEAPTSFQECMVVGEGCVA